MSPWQRLVERIERRRIVRAIRREDRIERRLYGDRDLYGWSGTPQNDNTTTNDKEN